MRAIAAAAALLAVPASCSSLVGFEGDYTVDPTSTTSGGGQGGDSGVGGDGGSGASGGEGGVGGAPEACEHDVCIGGPPLVVGCNECVTEVCAADDFCCTGIWDDLCVEGAIFLCDLECCGDGYCMGGNTCASCPADCGPCACPHSVCVPGDPLTAADCHDDECRKLVCAQMSDCCADGFSWTKACNDAATTICADDGGCVNQVCDSEASCCTSGWTQQCVNIAKSTCGVTCECEVEICTPGDVGEDVTKTCDPCVEAVCNFEPACCTGGWAPFCVAYASTICGMAC